MTIQPAAICLRRDKSPAQPSTGMDLGMIRATQLTISEISVLAPIFPLPDGAALTRNKWNGAPDRGTIRGTKEKARSSDGSGAGSGCPGGPYGWSVGRLSVGSGTA